MTAILWHYQQPRAALTSGRLRAELDVTKPQVGLSQMLVEDQPIPGSILQLHLSQEGAGAIDSPSETYIRGVDLITTYPQTEDRAFRCQAYWRGLATGSLNGHLTTKSASELIVSTQTSLLDSQPLVQIRSRLPAEQVLRLSTASSSQFIPLALSETPVTVTSSEGPGCFLVRLAGGSVSYCEMLAPTDFAQSHLSRTPNGFAELHHPLFLRHLEKGIILRARIRGVFVARQSDAEVAALWYHQLLQSTLPLTT